MQVSHAVIDFNVTGAKRKELVLALSEIVGQEPVYLGAPTFSYGVGSFSVNKDGVLYCPELFNQNRLDEILDRLYKQGFEPVPSGSTLVISLPIDSFDDGSISRLEQIVQNKAPLFKRAFQADTLVIVKQEDSLCFPWFSFTGNPYEAKAYMDFVSAISKMAREQKRVIPRVYVGDNDKYSMRQFLVRLGLKGKEYKESRKILMQNLTGNGAWRHGRPHSRHSIICDFDEEELNLIEF